MLFRDQLYFLPGPDGKSKPSLACAFSAWWPSILSSQWNSWQESWCAPSASWPLKPLVHALFWPLLSHDHGPTDDHVNDHCAWLFMTPWTVACQAPLSMGFFQAGILEWVAISFFKGSSEPRDQTRTTNVSCIGRRILYLWATRKLLRNRYANPKTTDKNQGL